MDPHHLDRTSGIQLRKELWRRWRMPITVPTTSRLDFFMVASFGRLIGFHIAKLLSFTCSAFVVFFHLWGFGGPNYVKEFEDWSLEERNTSTTPKPAAKIIGTNVLTGANQVPIGRKSVFQRLESPPMSPWCATKEQDLTDCGYSPAAIEATKQDYLRRWRAKQGIQDIVPCSTVFGRLRFPCPTPLQGQNSVFRRITSPPVPETNADISNGHLGNDVLPSHQITEHRHSMTTGDSGEARASSAMANFPVNPARFVPGLYDVIEVAGRPQQSRFHLSIEPPLPLDGPFLNIEGIINALLDHLGVHADAIEKCPLGDAYVRLMSASIKDWLILHIPHQHNNHLISFCEHNKVINWRAFNFNQEAWLMLLAFPFDNWTYENISYAVAYWGRLVHWDKAASTLARVIIKVKVADLSHIPFSIVVTDGDDMQGESWTVPVFILS
ncbi:hypothetical protein BRADI_1g39046v3 [Brachypodium distachyon]|uniref:DUF7597 domain-containing protein n=1 Tax=Brachypodium distachyon TaxID=15368 RepID=A0A0Q3JKJ5_BRADI|nr:hypothetical protein BRADI_1g39046v3 [Brachypodium distachyon]